MEKARGDYLAFLDADDCWSPRHLADFSKVLLMRPDTHYYSARTKFFRSRCPGFESLAVWTFKEESYLTLALKDPSVVNASSVIFSKKLLESVGIFNENMPVFEDIEFWLRAGNLSNMIYNTRTRVAVRKSSSGSLSARLDYYTRPEVVSFLKNMTRQHQPRDLQKFGHLNIYGTLMRYGKNKSKLPRELIYALDPRLLPFPKSLVGWIIKYVKPFN